MLLLGVSSVALGACTASLPTNVALAWGGSAQSGKPTEILTIAVPEGEEWPLAALEALSGTSGLGYRQVVVNASLLDEVVDGSPLESVDVLVGSDPLWLEVSGVADVLGAGEVRAADDVDLVTYGQDAACVLVNRSWFSANNVAMPDNLESLSVEQKERVAAVSDPLTSPSALALLPLWVGDWEVFEGPAGSADEASQSGAQSGQIGPNEGAATSPGVVGSALEPLRHPNNLGTDTQFKVLPDTCVGREVGAVMVTREPERAGHVEGFLDLLLSPQGQRIIAEHALAYPLDTSIAVQGAVPWTDVAPAYAPEQVLEGLRKWSDTF